MRIAKRGSLGVFIMEKRHRIAAGGLIFRNHAVLLVRYRGSDKATYLVGPGGALKEEENLVQAIIRETKEETGILISPRRVVLIEDLNFPEYKMSKTWMISDYVEGSAYLTEDAKTEGIMEVAWFSRAQLATEIVYPFILMQYSWEHLCSQEMQLICSPSRAATP
jgi:8-oxo-dGTP pyrophosphatase MutT (NUDIX family)